MDSLHHKKTNQSPVVKPITIVVAIAALFFLFTTFTITSVKTTEKIIECNSLYQQDMCEYGYVRQVADFINFSPLNLVNLFVIPTILILFTVLVLALCRDDVKFRNIIMSIWYGIVIIGLAGISITASSMSKHPQLHSGGLSQDESSCLSDSMNALDYSGEIKDCTGDAAGKPMLQYWKD